MTVPFAAASPVVKRYAGALFELAVETKRVAELAAPVSALRALEADAEIMERLTDPRISLNARKDMAKMLAKAVKAPDIVESLLMLLAKNQRLGLVTQVATAYVNLQDTAEGVMHVRLESAYNLTDTQKVQLRLLLKTFVSAKDVRLDETVDTELKAGFRAFWSDKVWDTSLKGQLEKLETTLRGVRV
jgi:F-type H+-transporting ATPase subunit delta